MESLGIICVLSIHSTTIQFSNLISWAHPYNFFAFLIHGLWFGRSYKNRPVAIVALAFHIMRKTYHVHNSKSLLQLSNGIKPFVLIHKKALKTCDTFRGKGEIVFHNFNSWIELKESRIFLLLIHTFSAALDATWPSIPGTAFGRMKAAAAATLPTTFLRGLDPERRGCRVKVSKNFLNSGCWVFMYPFWASTWDTRHLMVLTWYLLMLRKRFLHTSFFRFG